MGWWLACWFLITHLGTIGAAWHREDGSFLIRLDPCVVVRWDDPVFLSLFPVDAGGG